MPIDSEVLSWISDAAAAATSWEDISSELRGHDPDGEDPRLRPFVFAFTYTLHERFGSARERAGGPFGAMLAGDGWRFPPALDDLPQDDVTAWTEALAASNDPIVSARLGDLLWERKAQPDPHLAAGAACDGLLAISEDEAWRGMDRVRCLSRALELARGTHDAERQAKVVAHMLEFAKDDLRSDSGGPGLSLGALRPLVDLSIDERPDALDDLLQQVADKYGSDPHIIDSVADLRSRLLDETHRQELRRQQVQRWRDEARRGDGILRVHRLEQALEIARQYGLNTEADELRRELGTIRPDELKLERISAELELPREEVDRFLKGFEQAKSWQEALRTLAVQGPPGGSPQELHDYVEQLMEDHPVQFLFAKVLAGPDNASAVFRAATPEQHRRLALAEQRAQQARMWGLFCSEAMQRIGARSDRPSREALTGFLSGDLVETEVAERIARAIELFWDKQFDESAHVLVPRLERVLREMARKVGIPVVREPRPGREVGGVEMLGALMRDLEGAFADSGWHAYLWNLLADPLGLNLRNSITHGLHGSVGAIDASLLTQGALLLAGMSLKPVENPPEPPRGAGPSSPDDPSTPS